MQITTKSNNFQFYEFNSEKLGDVFKLVSGKDEAFDLEKERPGFVSPGIEIADDEVIACGYREILSQEIEALEDGKIQTVKHWIVEEAHLVIFRDLIVAYGKNKAINSALLMILKMTKCEPKPLFTTPEKLFRLSEHMAFITTMDLGNMAHPTVKKLHFDGKIETLADIAPFHNYTENIKSVKGVINTPHGIRTMKITGNGKIQISKKKEEELDTDLFRWVYKFVKGGGAR